MGAKEQPVSRRYLSLGDSMQLQPVTRAGPALALSPDGTRLAFIGDTLFRIWIKSRDALEPVVIAGTERASNPVFSPDGRWIAYTADNQLRKVPVEGGASVTIADSVGRTFGLAWLDDGTLVFPVSSLLGLRRVSQTGGPISIALDDSVFGGLAPIAPTPLPGARGVLFQVCASGCVTMSLHVLDLNTGREKLLFKNAGMGWYLPSGHIFYVRNDGVALLVPFDLKTLEPRGWGRVQPAESGSGGQHDSVRSGVGRSIQFLRHVARWAAGRRGSRQQQLGTRHLDQAARPRPFRPAHVQ